MQDTTVRPATGDDAYMQGFAAEIAAARAADHRRFAAMQRAWRLEEGIEVDDDTDPHEAKADELDAVAKRHKRSAWMIRRQLNATRAPTTPAPDVIRAAALSAPRERRDRRAASPSRAGPDDDSESSEPPERRLCGNKRCEADISHLHPERDHCDNACKQAAYRDRQALKRLNEFVGTVADRLSCSCFPKRHLVHGGVCFSCGKPRGVVTRGWLEDEAVAA
jgi:hypothetical protein